MLVIVGFVVWVFLVFGNCLYQEVSGNRSLAVAAERSLFQFAAIVVLLGALYLLELFHQVNIVFAYGLH